MGKLLKLHDGTEYTATAASTITDIQIAVGDYTDVETIKRKMTVTNLSAVTFDGRPYADVVLIDDKAYRSGAGVTAEFLTELSIEDRIEMERQAAIDEYTMQLIEEGVL